MSTPLKLQPVPDYGLPDYPTRDQYESGDEPLECHWPDAWKYGRGFLKGLLLAAGLSASGCSSESIESEKATSSLVEAAHLDPFGFEVESAPYPHPIVLEGANWTRAIYDQRPPFLGFVGTVGATMPSTHVSEDQMEIELGE